MYVTNMGDASPLKKAGLLGGSFAPVHKGHLLIAHNTMESLKLEEVFFIPAAQAPLKARGPAAKATHRRAMLETAIQHEPRFQILDTELQAGGVNYTIDTVRTLAGNHPDHQFFWILGADQVQQLPDWKDICELCMLIEFAALNRPGHPVNTPDIPNLRCHQIHGHTSSISSSKIRERLRQKKSVRDFLPENVAKYISDHQLYQADDNN